MQYLDLEGIELILFYLDLEKIEKHQHNQHANTNRQYRLREYITI